MLSNNRFESREIALNEFSGYMHPTYAQSFAEFGTPRQLPRTKGWILERDIPGCGYRDAMGCYPLFMCADWSQLTADVEDLSGDVIALSIVSDPFGRYSVDCLRQCFGDVVIPFKEHCVMDLRNFCDEVSAHHRRYARKALAQVLVEEHGHPEEFLDEYMKLHGALVAKHNIRGLRALSRYAIGMQLRTPGIVVLKASHAGVTVAAILWYLQPQEDVVFGHILGCSDIGYKLGALYAIYWTALEYFGRYVRWCDVGGIPGVASDEQGGLAWFKRGWSQQTRTAYFCGRILDRERYQEVVEARRGPATSYFPAYRAGEMG